MYFVGTHQLSSLTEKCKISYTICGGEGAKRVKLGIFEFL
jgi:hypothetical protein